MRFMGAAMDLGTACATAASCSCMYDCSVSTVRRTEEAVARPWMSFITVARTVLQSITTT